MTDERSPADFYDDLAELYHHIYLDWEAGIAWQGRSLDAIIRDRWPGSRTVLDVSCGIGTQSLGLAALGYDVTAADVSPGAVARARREAAARGLDVAFEVADMRVLAETLSGTWDVVLSADNAFAHILDDGDLSAAMTGMIARTRTRGGVLLTLRDYPETLDPTTQVHAYGVRETPHGRVIPLQVWDAAEGTYLMTFYVIRDDGRGTPDVSVFRTRAKDRPVDSVLGMMRRAGLMDVERIDGVFYEPVLVGTKPSG